MRQRLKKPKTHPELPAAKLRWRCDPRRLGFADTRSLPGHAEIIGQAEGEVKAIQNQYASGLLTDGERYNKVVDIWTHTSERVAKTMMDQLGSEEVTDSQGKTILKRREKSLIAQILGGYYTYSQELDDFASAILEKKAPRVSVAQASETMRIIELVQKSGK